MTIKCTDRPAKHAPRYFNKRHARESNKSFDDAHCTSDT